MQAEACNFIKKGTLVQLFFWEFCEMSKKVFSYRALPVAASVLCKSQHDQFLNICIAFESNSQLLATSMLIKESVSKFQMSSKRCILLKFQSQSKLRTVISFSDFRHLSHLSPKNYWWKYFEKETYLTLHVHETI